MREGSTQERDILSGGWEKIVLNEGKGGGGLSTQRGSETEKCLLFPISFTKTIFLRTVTPSRSFFRRKSPLKKRVTRHYCCKGERGKEDNIVTKKGRQRRRTLNWKKGKEEGRYRKDNDPQFPGEEGERNSSESQGGGFIFLTRGGTTSSREKKGASPRGRKKARYGQRESAPSPSMKKTKTVPNEKSTRNNRGSRWR